MKVITVTNRKGGSGKTTVAVHLAAGLATRGYNVGIIDTDSQGHSALMLGLPQENSLYRVMIEDKPLVEEVVIVPPDLYTTPDKPAQGKLFLLRGYDKTYKIPYDMDATAIFAFHDLCHRFGELAGLDIVIVDTQPTMSQFDGAVYLATDAFLYPTECEMLSITGLTEAIEQMKAFNQHRERYLGSATRILGIIPNKMRTNTVLNQHNIAVLGREFGVFDKGGLVMSPLRLLTVWGQACNERVPVFVFEPSGEAAVDAWRIVDNVEQRLKQWQGEIA
jgi:chromosome partitioning protein